MHAASRLFKNSINKHVCLIKDNIDKSGAKNKAIASFNFGFGKFKPITIWQKNT